MEYPHLRWDYIWVISGFKTGQLVAHEDAHPNSFLDNKWTGVDSVPHLTTISAFRRSSTVSANVGSGASCG